MWRTALILLLAAFAACSSSPAEVDDSDPFVDATPVEGGIYDQPELPTGPTSSPVSRFLHDEWQSSLLGWSFTSRSIGRWAQRDWDRLFGASE